MRITRSSALSRRLGTGFFLVFLTFSGSAFAQFLDNKGTDFILSFLPNFQNQGVQQLHLTSDTATTVSIAYPVNLPTFTTNVALTPGEITIVDLPNSVSSGWTANVVDDNAVRVFGPNEFVAYLINIRPFSSDAALGLPIDTMNTDYIVATYDPAFVGAQFLVYAAFDNTEVSITPVNDIIGRSAGATFTVTLNRGEGYFGRSAVSGGPAGDLSGSLISASRPVGLINGNGCTQVPNGTIACDHIFEVAQPVQSWGSEVLVTNLPNRPNGVIYRILAAEDNTTIRQNGAVLGTVDKGEFIETPPLPDEHVFSGDRPIFVTQFMTGVGSPGAISGDPAMGNLVPTAQFLSNYTFSTVGGSQFTQHFLSVIAENSDVGSLLLDGVPIPAGEYTPIPGSGFSAAKVPLTDDTHTTSSFGVHGITVEGYNSADSYLYPGGALFDFINPMGDANAPLCDAEVDDGPPPFLMGSATDDRPSEDANDNGQLDPGEDLNGNGVIDADTGIFFVTLGDDSDNLALSVEPFVPGDGGVDFTVDLIDAAEPGTGTVRVSDGAGNICLIDVELGDPDDQMACDIDGNDVVDRADIGLIFFARGDAAEQDDLRDVDGDELITVNDARACVLLCTNPQCLPD